MTAMRLRQRLLIALALGLLVAATMAGPAAAGGGNSVAAHRCQMGGWQTLQDGAGQPFASQSACVSYAANGGALFHPVVTVTSLPGGPFPFGTYAWLDLEGAGFHPNSSITMTSPMWTTSLIFPPTDGSGAWSLDPLLIWCPYLGLGPGDIVSSTITGTDTYGVTATGIVSAPCQAS
ncbi:MAG TPA: hypothetical protein VF484_07485 [Candidatus Limnocylindrales bacterium]